VKSIALPRAVRLALGGRRLWRKLLDNLALFRVSHFTCNFFDRFRIRFQGVSCLSALRGFLSEQFYARLLCLQFTLCAPHFEIAAGHPETYQDSRHNQEYGDEVINLPFVRYEFFSIGHRFRRPLCAFP
jgi:hypothetical protein